VNFGSQSNSLQIQSILTLTNPPTIFQSLADLLMTVRQRQPLQALLLGIWNMKRMNYIKTLSQTKLNPMIRSELESVKTSSTLRKLKASR
jgi:hypothetical protein